VNGLPGYLYLISVTNRDPGGEVVTGLAEGVEYMCPKCGMYVPPRATTCLFCKSEIEHGATDQESVDDILNELSGLLHVEEEVESDMKASTDETAGLEKKVPNKKGRTSRRVARKVIYKKVSKRPP